MSDRLTVEGCIRWIIARARSHGQGTAVTEGARLLREQGHLHGGYTWDDPARRALAGLGHRPEPGGPIPPPAEVVVHVDRDPGDER